MEFIVRCRPRFAYISLDLLGHHVTIVSLILTLCILECARVGSVINGQSSRMRSDHFFFEACLDRLRKATQVL